MSNPDTEHSPSELARTVARKVRAEHVDCDEAACPLSAIFAEDVQEILDIAQTELGAALAGLLDRG